MLREVARCGSIAGAASSLGYTPSAVSQQLTKLEREVGVSLLDRGPRSVELTEAGRRLADHTDIVLARLREAEAEIRELGGVECVRLASFATAEVTLVPDAAARLRRRHPSVELSLRELDPLVSLEQLRDRETDLALVLDYEFVPLPERHGITRMLLLEEALNVMLPSDHPLASKRAVALTELAGEPWIRRTRRSFCHPFTVRACRAAGFEPRIGAEVDDQRALERLVAGGVGIAFAPEMLRSDLGADLVVRPVAVRPPQRRVFIAWWNGAESIPVLRDAIEALLEAARERDHLTFHRHQAGEVHAQPPGARRTQQPVSAARTR
jgi:DNA-binding transcriptional LysR family regulator